jgi:hypothetical protein
MPGQVPGPTLTIISRSSPPLSRHFHLFRCSSIHHTVIVIVIVIVIATPVSNTLVPWTAHNLFPMHRHLHCD